MAQNASESRSVFSEIPPVTEHHLVHQLMPSLPSPVSPPWVFSPSLAKAPQLSQISLEAPRVPREWRHHNTSRSACRSTREQISLGVAAGAWPTGDSHGESPRLTQET